MRALFAIVVSAIGLVAVSAAVYAADLGLSTQYDIDVPRAQPQVFYRYEPGVAMRAYWLPPWRGHHYFPHTGKRPAIGRYEKLPARHRAARGAQSYERYWSNAAAFTCGSCAWLQARDQQVLPDRRDIQIPSARRAPNQ